ncbi:hypothetical protein [Acinetobacter sp. LMB-5]|uniref:hypothetical protein n=1 Tax=Acinetobacter sp. LMB-5 TaxID=1609919 RepID=UPI000760C35A|nr:hypothetical protein [Acinetobacter sp. LMB-5]
MIKRIVNPFYICFFLSNILFYRDFDEVQTQGVIFNSIDFTSLKHIDILLEELVKPEFMRLDDSTKERVMHSLYYMNISNNQKFISFVLGYFDLLDFSEIAVDYFLRKMWEIFFDGIQLNLLKEDFNVSYKVLNDNNINYILQSESKDMSGVLDEVYGKILNI